MAGLKIIKRRLVSIKNTMQITRAMKLVSAAKLNRAQEAVARSREYSVALNIVMKSLLKEIDTIDITHPLMKPREQVKNVCLLIVGGGRGLCGAYNSNVNKAVEAFRKEHKSEGLNIDAVIIGKKAAEYFRRMKYKYSSSHEKISEDPNAWPLLEIAQGLEADFLNEKVDEVYIVYTHFKSIMSQRTITEKLLPFSFSAEKSTEKNIEKITEKTTTNSTDNSLATEAGGLTIFEPSREQVFSRIIPRLMRMKIQQAALESKASEHASRMTSMDAATKNAGELKEKLQLKHNRLRQSRITSELLDILGGAQA